jgi:hypothetical protein
MLSNPLIMFILGVVFGAYVLPMVTGMVKSKAS